ncbi:MAG: hypothetical protein PHH26_00295 [Candidatus Thermoplasmatota archaeon]|nr:hypothetical protein [Candidatus Thermoplasmatota archaeon]
MNEKDFKRYVDFQDKMCAGTITKKETAEYQKLLKKEWASYRKTLMEGLDE